MRQLKLITAALLLGLSASSNAAVLGGCVTGGSIFDATSCKFKHLDTGFKNSNNGNGVGKNDFNRGFLYAFDEKQNVFSNEYKSIVSSHYVFFDPKKTKTVKGWVQFDGDIIDVTWGRKGLKNTEVFFGLDSVNYKYNRAVGLEQRDRMGTFYSANTLFIEDWKASSPGDHIRVIIQTVPEPGALGLLVLGLVGLGFSRRKVK